MSGKRALIIGCGVSGPVLATYLKKIGIEPVVYERRSELSSAGGGSFNLAPNGIDVLRTLGLDEDMRAVGHPTNQIAFHNHKGKQLGRNPESMTLLNRGKLQQVLVRGAERASVTIEFDKKLTEVHDEPGTVGVSFSDGTSAEGDLLIGCDGLRSRVREMAGLKAEFAPMEEGKIE